MAKAPARLLAYLAATLVAAAGAHVAWSLLLAAGLSTGFHHRIFDAREVAIDNDTRLALFAGFVEHRVDEEAGNTVGFFGSSFTYGYPWQQDRIFSSIFAANEPKLNVFNASLIGSDIDGIVNHAICPLLTARQRLAAAFVEIPITNSVVTIENFRRLKRAKPDERCAAASRWSGFAPIFLRHPYGIGWLPLLWDKESYDKPDEPLIIGKLPQDYFRSREEFEAVLPQYREWLATAIGRLRQVADKIYIFPTPIYVPGVKEAGGDEQAVELQFQATLEVCRSLAGVTCLDSSHFVGRREYFYNLTHLNQRGHRAFAEWLLTEFNTSRHDS